MKVLFLQVEFLTPTNGMFFQLLLMPVGRLFAFLEFDNLITSMFTVTREKDWFIF